MISDNELMIKIEEETKKYTGDISHFYEAVGMVVVGRLFGWRVMRLVSGRRVWGDANKLFGDPKLLMPERGKYADKSLGLQLAEKLGDYWEIIKRHKSMSIHEKRIVQ